MESHPEGKACLYIFVRPFFVVVVVVHVNGFSCVVVVIVLLRGTLVNRTCGIHKYLYI